jgi:hypothetical protein
MAMPPQITPIQLSNQILEILEDFREKCYDDICNYFEDINACILEQTLNITDFQ